MVKNMIYTLDVRTDIYQKGDYEINNYGESSKWKNRLCEDDPKVCVPCDEEHGHISGKRNKQRILYSNDGLIFVTYDHYRRFYEII